MNQDDTTPNGWKTGEIVELKVDEIAKETIYCQELSIRLKRGEIFQNPCQGKDIDPQRTFHFTVEETIHHELKKFKKSAQYLDIYSTIFKKIFIVILLLSLVLNVFKFTNVDVTYENAIIFLTRYQIYTIIPLLNIQIPLINLIIKSYCNAYILTLFDALQQSKTDFEDEDDVDEFDAAPAPTKEFRLSWRLIANKITNGFKVMKLGLVEDLASCTVLCSVDKMGSIARQIPAIDQVLLVEESPTVLDLNYKPDAQNGVVFEDNDWSSHLKTLKPFGLQTLLTTSCGVLSGRKRNDLHLKTSGPMLPGQDCRKVCLCHIGREVGFSVDALQDLLPQMFIDTTSSQPPPPGYHKDEHSLSSVIISDGQSYQVFSEGNLELILDSCIDYWSGTDLEKLTDPNRQKILEFANNAIISDLQVMGFAYRPIQNPEVIEMVKGLKREQPYKVILNDQSVHTVTFQLENDHDKIYESPVEMEKDRELGRDSRIKIRSKIGNRLDSLVDTANHLTQEEMCMEVTKSQTFLCACSFVYQPKPNMVDFVEDLGLAGIRFVYFSPAPERESKAYAERLGLEIDWNSCIILSPDKGGQGYLAVHDNKAQLPRGVGTIRDHIAKVDDVPLHVSLFAECTPDSIQEMIEIFQEHGEVVCCIGSSLNPDNIELYSTADISISIDPMPLYRHKIGQGQLTPQLISAMYISTPCALTLNSDSSLYSITQMIREARCLAENGRQTFAFYIGCQVSLSALIFISSCTLVPKILEGYQIMFIIWFLCPILACSLLFTPHLPDIMTHVPAKNKDHWTDVPRFICYYIIRFCTIPVFSGISIYWLLILTMSYGPKTSYPTYIITDSKFPLVFFIQNYVALVFVCHLVIISGTFVHRIDPSYAKLPYCNVAWLGAGILCIVFQLLFFIISMATLSGSTGRDLLMKMPWWIHVFSIVTLMLSIPVQEFVKAHDRRKWLVFQKRTKLEFNTKLGMHSPL